ncbi:MAG: ribonuclease HI [Peptococcaceae bacterium]|nr:ribonuclease HI [Peptococcaceae bacterium]
MALKKVIIHTDGACSGNPGPGGWGAVLQYGQHIKEISGYETVTTNQRMELTAAIKALELLKEPCEVELYSDSAYLINAFEQKWLHNWQRNGWLNAQKKPVENMDLWKKLLELSAQHKIKWIKVKGHAGNSQNEKCDQLARKAIAQGLIDEQSRQT